MTDTELVEYLNLTPEQALRIIPNITPERRATYDRMKRVEQEANAWAAGKGPKPQGVLLDGPRRAPLPDRLKPR